MSKPTAIIKQIPDDIRCQDSMDNQVQAFLVAMKDILNNQCVMMMDKKSYIEHKKVEQITLPEGYKVIST